MLRIDEIVDTKGRLVPSRENSHAKYLGVMQAHQDMVRMHADLSVGEHSAAMSAFLDSVSKILPEPKFRIFKNLLSTPLDTVPVVSTVFDRLGRIFEGVNPVYNYFFKKPEYAADWDVYRKERLDEPNVWREKAWQYFQTEPNSVLVVDMPVERKPGDKYLQPYYYWVTTNDIIDYSTKENGDIAWIIYRNEDRKRIYIVDDTYYRSFPYSVNGVGEWELDRVHMTENRHPLGYCPATFFLSDPISLSMPDVKRSPITKALGLLNWYLFFRTSEKHLDLSGSYPIYSGYESKCDYEAEIVNEGGSRSMEICNGHGTLVDEDGNVITDPDTGLPKVCPKCHGRHNTAGPGSFIEVPIPESGDGGIPDLIEAVKVLNADVKALEFNDKKATSLKNEIISTCVGVEGDVFTEFSISEKQVDANYESQSTILIRIKKEIENAQWFVDHTCCLLRYGKEYISCQINYGTKFYTLTAEKLREIYKKAKDSGAPQSDLIAMRKQIIETDYRTDPLMCERMLILADVEPLLGMTDTEAADMLSKGLVDENDVKVKVNFDSLIRRFEIENGDILNFGSDTDYKTKITTIQKTLKNYVREIKPKNSDPAGV